MTSQTTAFGRWFGFWPTLLGYFAPRWIFSSP